jgi:hypothetical protein
MIPIRFRPHQIVWFRPIHFRFSINFNLHFHPRQERWRFIFAFLIFFLFFTIHLLHFHSNFLFFPIILFPSRSPIILFLRLKNFISFRCFYDAHTFASVNLSNLPIF